MRCYKRSLFGIPSGAFLLGVGLLLTPFGAEANAAKCDVPPVWDKKIPDAKKRFVPVLPVSTNVITLPAGYCDRETGLVWQTLPGARDDRGGNKPWSLAIRACASVTDGGRMGWRLPSVHELTSLVVPGNPAGGPDLPPGHPFINVQSSFYWSATADANDPTLAWNVDFLNGNVSSFLKANAWRVWCVRGGGPLAAY